MKQATLQDLVDYIYDANRLSLDHRTEAMLIEDIDKIDNQTKEMFGINYDTLFDIYFDLMGKHRDENWTTINTNLTQKEN